MILDMVLPKVDLFLREIKKFFCAYYLKNTFRMFAFQDIFPGLPIVLAVFDAFVAKFDAFLPVFFVVQTTDDAFSDVLPTSLSETDVVFGKLVVH